jgi:hypothetical protein
MDWHSAMARLTKELLNGKFKRNIVLWQRRLSMGKQYSVLQ